MGRLPAEAGARTVVIDPARSRRVYVASEAGKVYRSDDAGESWAPAAQGLPEGGVAALALDPRRPERLYAATPAGMVYVSEDGAGSWRR